MMGGYGPPPGMPPQPHHYGMMPPMPMMPPRPPYAAQADARLRMPGGHEHHPTMPGMGPPVTVFVGNITEKAQDAMVRHLLNTCGPVTSWKRVQGATGKLQAFGFCEFGNPDAALRGIRILHDWEIGDKKLVVKVDAKTKNVLDDFKRKKRKALLGEEKDAKADQNNVTESEYVDKTMKHDDELTKDRIRGIIREHSKEINSYITASDNKREHGSRSRRTTNTNSERNEDGDRLTGPKESLDDVDLEDGKRDIIHREIDKFRETMKIREAEKELEKQKREKDQDVRPPPPTGGGRDPEPRRSKPRERERDSVALPPARRRGGRSRSRSFSPEEVGRRNNRSRSQSRRDVSRSRSRSQERRSRSRRDSPPMRERKDPKDVRREREQEEEDKEMKRADRKARDKEASYQERLRKWEARELKMTKNYENDRLKEARRLGEQEHEGKKLREFLEDYDDDRDDEKYYKGSKLDRRMGEREREAAKDAEDRAWEKEEIEELRVQILHEGHPDPNAELGRRMAKLDGHMQVEIVDLDDEQAQDICVSPPRHDDHTVPEVIPMDDDDYSRDAPSLIASDTSQSPKNDTPVVASEVTPTPQQKQSFIQMQPSRKKIDVKDVFNQEDDEMGSSKKKKLPPLPTALTTSTTASSDKKKTSSDDKRKHIKSLIDKIPTEKNALFEYNIDWELVDNQLMEKRIRPWVNKKIAEYIGEPEPTLTDFICSKVLAGSSPKAVLDDVQMVLDEEAEVFVVKMWRLLIYEIENKKLKTTSTQAPPNAANA
jgi:RNA-binding protein 25